MSKTKKAPKKFARTRKSRRVSGPTFQAALDALAGLDKDAERSGADELSMAEINKLIRSVRAGKRAKGKSA